MLHSAFFRIMRFWCAVFHRRHWQRFESESLSGQRCGKCQTRHYDGNDWSEPKEETF